MSSGNELFTVEKFNDRLYVITDLGHVRMFLVIGDEKACLIDSGFGVGNIKKFIEENITDKYCFNLTTHCHIDHVNGCGLYDECYLNEKDWDMYENAYRFDRRLEKKAFADMDPATFDPKRTIPFLNVKDGDEFDLGGITLKAIECPGHSPGSIVILIKEMRICIYGDAIGRRTGFTGAGSIPISEFLKGLYNVKKYDGQYDVILRNHNDLTCPLDMLDNVIECAESILNNTDDRFPLVYHGTPCFAAREVNEKQTRVDGKLGNIFYIEEKRK